MCFISTIAYGIDWLASMKMGCFPSPSRSVNSSPNTLLIDPLVANIVEQFVLIGTTKLFIFLLITRFVSFFHKFDTKSFKCRPVLIERTKSFILCFFDVGK